MRNLVHSIGIIAFVLCIALPISADEGFGFGFDDEAGESTSAGIAPSVTVSGEAKASILAHIDELDSSSSRKAFNAGPLFTGKLGFDASAANAEASVNLNLDAAESIPVSLSEAWVRGYWGKLDLTAGIQKLTWGKADIEGPLDMINPIDYSDLTVIDQMDRKIARPLVHASWAAGSFTKVEAVFIPGFEPSRFDTDGRWKPNELSNFSSGIAAVVPAAIEKTLTQMVGLGLINPMTDPAGFAATQASLTSSITKSLTELEAEGVSGFFPNTETIKYGQFGLRATTTIESHDMGLQYFTGNLRKPSVSVDSATAFTLDLEKPEKPKLVFDRNAISVSYDRYHQFGADWATVLAGFNLRAEAAINLTADLKGTDGAIANPAALWSIGFDRDIIAGINVNAQGTGSVRLMHNKLGGAPDDCEAGKDLTSTRIMLRLSRKFFRDEVEFLVTGLWGIEDADWYVIPELNWVRNSIALGVRAGFFGGNSDGELGQYKDNDYATLMIKYLF